MTKLYLQALMIDSLSKPFGKEIVRAWNVLKDSKEAQWIFENLSYLVEYELLCVDAVISLNLSCSKEQRFLAQYRLSNACCGIAKLAEERKSQQYTPGIISPEIAELFMTQKSIRGDLYKMASGFSDHLFRADLDLPNALIKANLSIGESLYIQFADDQEFKTTDGHLLTCCIVSCVPTDFENKKASLFLSFPEIRIDGSLADTSNWVSLDLHYENFEQSISNYLALGQNFNVPPDVLRYAAKCLLYIKSGEPDLYKPVVRQPNRQARRQILKGKSPSVDRNNFGLVFVGYNYVRRFRDAEGGKDTIVRGHYRWQPYGPGRQKYKLIWIDAHVRSMIGTTAI